MARSSLRAGILVLLFAALPLTSCDRSAPVEPVAGSMAKGVAAGQQDSADRRSISRATGNQHEGRDLPRGIPTPTPAPPSILGMDYNGDHVIDARWTTPERSTLRRPLAVSPTTPASKGS